MQMSPWKKYGYAWVTGVLFLVTLTGHWVAGWYAGSPQSREGDERLEDKLDAILRSIDPGNAERLIRDLDQRYPGRQPGGI